MHSMESFSLNNNMTMIIKIALAKDDPDCVLSRSHGVSAGGGKGGSALPSPRHLCSKYLEDPSWEVAL